MLRILFAENDHDNLNIFIAMAKLLGHDVAGILHHDNMCPMLKLYRPDVIFVDLHTHQLEESLALCEKIKQDPMCRQAFLVALANDSTPQIRRQAFQGGCNAYFTKPFYFYQMRELLTMLTTKHQVLA